MEFTCQTKEKSSICSLMAMSLTRCGEWVQGLGLEIGSVPWFCRNCALFATSVGFMSCKLRPRPRPNSLNRCGDKIKNQEHKYHHLCSVEESFLRKEHFFFFSIEKNDVYFKFLSTTPSVPLCLSCLKSQTI